MDNNNSILGNPYQGFPYQDSNKPDLNTVENDAKHYKLKIIACIVLAILVNIIVLMYINGQHIYKIESTDEVKTDTITK